MPATSLQELFAEEIRDIYDGEKRLVRALPKMAKAANSRALKQAFTAHLKETQSQVKRLERVFRSLGQKPRGKKCDGLIGIIEEGNKAIEELDGAVLDAALIAGAQKVEHYEIASYGTLAYFAELLDNDDAKALLGQTLEEEKAADSKLSAIAKSDVNRDALRTAGNDDEDTSSESVLSTTARRVGASLGLVNSRGSISTNRSSGGSSRKRTRR